MINWAYYPACSRPPDLARAVVSVFESASPQINSRDHTLNSSAVLNTVAPGLAAAGFRVETGKKKAQKLCVPVLFGRNGKVEKSFDADAWHEAAGFVLEVEAGRGVDNNQFLKDLFQACMMQEVTCAAIAVRNRYRGSDDFTAVCRFFDTLYASSRLRLPLEGVLVLGY
jgi:hypothetical protein